MHKVLVTGAGGGGGNNLIRSLKSSSLDLRILGSNCQPDAVAKSSADQTFLLPRASEPDYLILLNEIIEREGIDLLIPNNDTEVGVISANREAIQCRTFLPTDGTVAVCQDKNSFFSALQQAGVAIPDSIGVTSIEQVEQEMARLPVSEFYWVRPRRGSGSCGATWVRTASQARMWIELWCDLRGYHAEDFQISRFLPGRDYNLQSIWNKGKLMFLSLAERLAYYGGENKLSGMASTPAIARTIHDQAAIDSALSVIHSIDPNPHGSFNVDMKCSAGGAANVTEINIGRFPMITTIHDAERATSGAEVYVRCALSMPVQEVNEIDFTEGLLMIRELDTEPLVIHERNLPGFSAESLREKLARVTG